MKMEVTEIGPVKRAIKIEVPPEIVNQEFDKVYTDIKRQAKIPGFRPGKAPMAMLEKRFGKLAEQDVTQRLVPDYYQRAIREAKVSPVLVEIPPMERIKAKRNSSLTFTATVEIKPFIELRDYRPPNPISLKRDDRNISESDVDGAIERFREQQARLEAAPTGTILDDALFAVVSIEGTVEGQPIEGSKKEGHLHRVGSQEQVLGLSIDEVIKGKKEGDTVELEQAYPASHPDERLAGKTVVFSIAIQGVKQKNLPVLDDEFAKDCGPYENLAQFKEKVQSELESVLKRNIEDGYKDQIIERLVSMHHFDIPDVLIDREVRAMVRQRLMEEQRKQAGNTSLDQKYWEEEVKRIQQDSTPEGKRRVKLGLVLEAIADKEGVTVGDQEIHIEMTNLAQGLQMPVEEIRKMVESGGDSSRQEFVDRIRAEKALQLVYQMSVIQG